MKSSGRTASSPHEEYNMHVDTLHTRTYKRQQTHARPSLPNNTRINRTSQTTRPNIINASYHESRNVVSYERLEFSTFGARFSPRVTTAHEIRSTMGALTPTRFPHQSSKPQQLYLSTTTNTGTKNNNKHKHHRHHNRQREISVTNLSAGRQSNRISHDVASDGAHELVRNVTQFLSLLRQLYIRLFHAVLPAFVFNTSRGSKGERQRGNGRYAFELATNHALSCYWL